MRRPVDPVCILEERGIEAVIVAAVEGEVVDEDAERGAVVVELRRIVVEMVNGDAETERDRDREEHERYATGHAARRYARRVALSSRFASTTGASVGTTSHRVA